MPADINNAILRHQVYLEGVKASAYDEVELEERARAIEAQLLALIAALGVANLSDLTLKRLNGFLRRARNLVGLEFRKLARAVAAYTREFYSVENTIQREILRQTQERARFDGVLQDIRKLIDNKIVPGSGVRAKQMIPNFLRGLETELVRLIRGGYANALSLQELIDQLLGEGREALKGWTGKIRRNGRSGINTLLQHIATNLGAFNQAQVFDRYQWVSVIDDRTTEICTDRDGKVYVYGKGPIPPAHHNCRSTVVPYREDADGLPEWRGSTWYEWSKEQPPDLLADMLGRAEAEKILQEGAKASSFPKLTTVKKLPLRKLLGKLQNILL